MEKMNKRERVIGNAISVTPIDEDKRLFNVVFATETPVQEYYWGEGLVNEILEISETAINTERINNGAPFLNNHKSDTQNVLGKVVENSFRIENKEAICTIQFSKRKSIDEIYTDFIDGIYRNISVGYTFEKYEIKDENGIKTSRVTNWLPLEISLATIPSDNNAKVRAMEIESQTIPNDKDKLKLKLLLLNK